MWVSYALSLAIKNGDLDIAKYLFKNARLMYVHKIKQAILYFSLLVDKDEKNVFNY